LDEGDLAAEIARSTKRYAKRQRVWLRGQAETTKVDAARAADVVELASRFLDRVATRGGIG
jgi:tRNA A37 N6-isopentenylltransferase MiaA